MPKLKGLLDSANAKLAGLLGDFPQGFNAGAVAGFPGWAGDMAYLADTARLALTGADSQAAPEDYVGTTDYIAKQAGYPVPQTLSGQLGAAVGGLMSPGPGDLAKFAPLGAMFLGAKAKTAMPDVLEYAQAMEKAGKSADEIWQTTAKLGQPWFKGADGKWRFEIDDSTASLIPSAFDNKFGDVRAEAPDALVHPDLWNAYSAEDIAAGGITLYPQSGSIAGQYSDGLVQVGTDAETFGAIASGKPLTYELTGETSTGLHELQHGVQQAEGFGRGGHWAQAFRDPRIWGKRGAEGSDIARKMLADKLAELQQVMSLDDYAKAAWQSDVVTPEIAADYARNYAPTVTKGVSPEVAKAAQETVAKDWYKRLAGEAEARNVQSRMNLTMDERIALPPWATQDVPAEQQIVRFGDGPAMAIEDFAARRAGKAKPYREAMGVDTMPAMTKPPETPDYGINHRPPMRNSGAPLYDATGGGNVYPDDVYSAKAQQYYGTGDAKLDRDTFRLLNAYKNEPDAPVTIYRAVPSDVDATDINPGDWVTINKAYADMHGQGFENGYKVIKKQVKARDIFTNGDSIHEWGYDPDGM